jgi:hypothetical protein
MHDARKCGVIKNLMVFKTRFCLVHEQLSDVLCKNNIKKHFKAKIHRIYEYILEYAMHNLKFEKHFDSGDLDLM